jgi:putative DNA primase/helicase
MLSLARPDVTVSSDALDANPWLLTVENGTLDLRTAKLREHRPEDLITKLAPVEYHSGAPAPRFEQFFRETLISADLIGFVRRMVGFSLRVHRGTGICSPLGRRQERQEHVCGAHTGRAKSPCS